MRTGVIAKKLGMSRHYTSEGNAVAVTLLKLDSCQVVAVRTEEKDGYNAVQLGAFNSKAKNTSKALKGHFAKAKVEPKREVAEFRVAKNALLTPGDELSVNHYVPGQAVDVIAVSKGKGFAGAMKRWNFRGLEASHGVSVTHRSHGSTGNRQDPGKVFKGKKMAGHLGVENKTIQNLVVLAVDTENQIVVVKGAVPGAKEGYVYITDAVKRARPATAPFPAGLKGGNENKKTEAKAEVVETNEQGKSDEN